MAVAHRESGIRRLTYEEYLAEGEIQDRYDITDGMRVVTSPTELHQDVLLNIAEAFRVYQRRSRAGKVILAPRDILISRVPLRTRQADVLFISNARRAQNPSASSPEPMRVAPELVVEILSPSENEASLAEKLADYRRVDVLECWVVNTDQHTVEALRLARDTVESMGCYGISETIRSIVFPDLEIAVDTLFEG